LKFGFALLAAPLGAWSALAAYCFRHEKVVTVSQKPFSCWLLQSKKKKVG
jgi:hypothetical protein